jgi:spore coat polysaccharide biosynthesis protein SpsF (cytidylyltransferase family)
MKHKEPTDINNDYKLIEKVMKHLSSSKVFKNDNLIGLRIGNFSIKSITTENKR